MERRALKDAATNSDPTLLILTVPAEMSSSAGELQAFASPLILRRGGLMLALPIGVIRDDLLLQPIGAGEEEMIGPSRTFEVELTDEDEQGSVFHTGIRADVLVIDFTDDILRYCREYDPVVDSLEEISPYSEGLSTGLPAFGDLLAAIQNWAEEETVGRVHFYSAREEQDVRPPALRKTPAKRVTNASLAEQVAALSAQVAVLSARQETASKEVPPLPKPGQASFATPATEPGPLAGIGYRMPPVSAGLQTPARLSPAKAMQLVGPPPKTRTGPSSGLALTVPDEPVDPLRAPKDPTELALSQQSAALTALVTHLIQGNDPFGLEASSSGATSSSTKGTLRREKLQQDLAARQSQFFLMVQQQVFKKLHPSSMLPKNEEELQGKGASLLTYLERYGGYRNQKEAGLCMWVLAHAMDAAAAGDFVATKEFLALGIMALEQSVFDAGDWGLAYVLALIEDPPPTMFQDKMASLTAAGRPFSPLVPPALASINLAYLKEIDLLQSRKADARGKKPQGVKGEEDNSSPSPKRKPKFPKKPKALTDG